VKKKAKASRKAKNVEEADNEDVVVEPVNKPRGSRKAQKVEEDENEEVVVKPIMKPSGGRKDKKAVNEDRAEEFEQPEEPAPAKKGRSRKVAKKEPTLPSADDEEQQEEDEQPPAKTTIKGKGGRKSKAVAAPKSGRRGRSGA
jgi:hypothetical protein